MSYNNIIGNEKVKNYLIEQIKKDDVLHSYLFLGIKSIGKLAIAKEFAKEILCTKDKNDSCKCRSCNSFESENHPDFVLLNKESDTIKIDQIRELTTRIIEKPIISTKKVYIINDSEKMTKEAQNSLLKTLEEPPKFATIILISSNESELLSTIKSRCMKIKFDAISKDEMLDFCKRNYPDSNISEERIKSFNGSIGRAVEYFDNKEEFEQLESIINEIDKKDIAQILLDSKILYTKEKIQEYLNYLINYIYIKSKENKRYLFCISHVDECLKKLKNNSNLDMCIDLMLIKIWEEINK